MTYQLSFLDDAQGTRDIWNADIESEHLAICWMWIIGDVWAQKQDWSVMELRCRRCCAGEVRDCPRSIYLDNECFIARVPARDPRSASQSERPQPRTRPIILIVEQDGAAATSYEDSIQCAGYFVGASCPDIASATNWLSTQGPDAAIIDVKVQDESCVALARRLMRREIPFLVVSEHPADTPGIHGIFRSVPWLRKPLTSAGLQLALKSLL